MENTIDFWKSRLEDIQATAASLKKGTSRIMAQSAGNRDIIMMAYGEKHDLKRKANFNSACGAGNPSFYADKKGVPPVVLLVGATHGGEMDAIVALLNLIRVFETGEDWRGKKHPFIHENFHRVRFVLIPCMNPDGRARLPFDCFIGKTFESMRYYMQGTWKDGSLCGYPDCKSLHPILDHVEFLGAYFNDNGINLMHDNFFQPMANETKTLMELADVEAPDFTVLLHSGGNGANCILPTHYVPVYEKEKLYRFDQALDQSSKANGLPFISRTAPTEDGAASPPPSFNLASALYHVTGGTSLVYETSMGLDAGGVVLNADQILDTHFLLFEQIIKQYMPVV
jgi:hypothetical protein